VRDRLLSVLNSWIAKPVQLLSGEDLIAGRSAWRGLLRCSEAGQRRFAFAEEFAVVLRGRREFDRLRPVNAIGGLNCAQSGMNSRRPRSNDRGFLRECERLCPPRCTVIGRARATACMRSSPLSNCTGLAIHTNQLRKANGPHKRIMQYTAVKQDMRGGSQTRRPADARTAPGAA